jgi:monovalent cation:H+ antiporter, CPA1 family
VIAHGSLCREEQGVGDAIAVIVAGILIGNRGPQDAMSDLTQRYVFGFWQLVDEILNSVLFFLIGLEVLVVGFAPAFAWLSLASIPLALFARYLAVAVPVLVLRARQKFAAGTITVLTWGGLRGGISIALALSLPEVAEKPALLAATYAVVVFTIIIQGLNLRAVVERLTYPLRRNAWHVWFLSPLARIGHARRRR